MQQTLYSCDKCGKEVHYKGFHYAKLEIDGSKYEQEYCDKCRDELVKEFKIENYRATFPSMMY